MNLAAYLQLFGLSYGLCKTSKVVGRKLEGKTNFDIFFFFAYLLNRKEAKVQMIRDRQVEANIVKILRERLTDCVLYNYPATRPSESDSPCYEVEVRR